MTVWTAILLGIVEGITIILPLSDSGHLAVLQDVFKLNYTKQEHLMFDALLHLAVLLAVCFVYREDVIKMVKGGARLARGQMDFSVFGDPMIPPTRQLLFIGIGTLPLILVAVFNSKIASLWTRGAFVGLALAATGMLLFVSDRLVRPGKKNARKMTVADAVIIGLTRACAYLPGLSCMAASLTVGMNRGLSRSYALRFAMLLSIPALLLRFLISLVRSFFAGIIWSSFPAYIIGFILAFLVSFASILVLQRIVHRGRYGRLAWYCWILGGITILLSIIL